MLTEGLAHGRWGERGGCECRCVSRHYGFVDKCLGCGLGSHEETLVCVADHEGRYVEKDGLVAVGVRQPHHTTVSAEKLGLERRTSGDTHNRTPL